MWIHSRVNIFLKNHFSPDKYCSSSWSAFLEFWILCPTDPERGMNQLFKGLLSPLSLVCLSKGRQCCCWTNPWPWQLAKKQLFMGVEDGASHVWVGMFIHEYELLEVLDRKMGRGERTSQGPEAMDGCWHVTSTFPAKTWEIPKF